VVGKQIFVIPTKAGTEAAIAREKRTKKWNRAWQLS